MALTINQGVQKVDEDRTFTPITQDNVQMVIQEIKLDEYAVDTLRLTYRILDGNNKNRLIIDRVCYNPDNKMSWKYRALRISANCPYEQGEPQVIDIETLLLNRIITADLSVREGADKDGNTKQYQSVKYKKTEITTTSQMIEEPTTEEELPFKETAEVVAPAVEPKQATIEEMSAQPSQSIDDEW